MTSHNLDEEDMEVLYRKSEVPYLDFVYKPHTMTIMIVAGIILVWYSFVDRETSDSVKVGMLSSAAVFLLFCVLQMRDGLFVRPHPAFWRAVQGLAILYLVVLVFALFQSVEDMRTILHLYDSSLGNELPVRSYADDCRVFTPEDPVSNYRNVRNTILDEFMIAHVAGWWGKVILMRDVPMAIFMSVLFEFYELSFRHWLPNFNECWWDQIIIDGLVCNMIGIFAGYHTLRFLKMRQYNWIGFLETKGTVGKVKRAILQFTPASWDRFQWRMLSSWRFYVGTLFVITIMSLIDLNAFFLKYVLWVPPSSHLNVVRLFLWWFTGMAGVREFYQFLSDPQTDKFGTNAWLCTANCLLELVIWLKYGRGMFTAPTPSWVVRGWTCVLTVVCVFPLLYFPYKAWSQSPQQAKVVAAKKEE